MSQFSTEFLMSRYNRMNFSILESKSSKQDSLESDLQSALNIAENKIGGESRGAKDASHAAIKQVLDRIPSESIKEEKPNPIIQKIFFNLTDPNRVEIIQEFIDQESKELDQIIQRNSSAEGTEKIFNRDDAYISDFNRSAEIVMRFEKLYNIYSISSNKIKMDREGEILKSLRAMDAEINLKEIGMNIKGKIGKIGGVDLDSDRESFEIISSDGKSILIPKSKIDEIIKTDNVKRASTPEHTKRMSGIAEKSADAIKNWYTWASSTFSGVVDGIKSGSETESDNKIDSATEFSDNTGGAVFNMVFNYGDKKTTVRNEIESIIGPDDIDSPAGRGRSGIRKKKVVFRKIKETLATAALPVIHSGEIRRPGDYFRLFTTLNSEKTDWMNTVLLNRVFAGQTEEWNSFKSGAATREGTSEASQLAYLDACVEWTYKFIESDYISTFTNKEMDDYRKSIELIVLEKKSEIKNYYLSKDFNLENFNSVLIKPEVSIPLYKTVDLAITEEDKRKESNLRNLWKGLGSAITGLFGGIQVDTAALARGRAFAEGDRRFMTGMNQFIKSVVGMVGGKTAANRYEKALPDKWKSEKTGKSVKEDMISPMDSPTGQLVPMEGPGSSHQTPGHLPGNNMDLLSLAGPVGGLKIGNSKTKSKKSGKKSKKKGTLNSYGTSRVLNFEDFMKDGEY